MSNPQDRSVPTVHPTLEPEVRQPSVLDQYKAPVKVIPSHLVVLLDPGSKKEEYFVAVKFDDQNVNWAKFVGFYLHTPVDGLIANYNEIIRGTDVSKFIEVIFPWGRIKSVRSLIYKHKAVSK
jgi:hypothetical protein